MWVFVERTFSYDDMMMPWSQEQNTHKLMISDKNELEKCYNSFFLYGYDCPKGMRYISG